MWTVNSTDVQQAKDRLERRRAEVEKTYAEEKTALDAELAVVETLERVASEFAVTYVREDVGDAPASLSESEVATGDEVSGSPEPGDRPEDAETAAAPPAAVEPAGGDEGTGGFDILKPGSRWRLNRGNRLPNPESASVGASPTTW
jgi:hypothetical protein